MPGCMQHNAAQGTRRSCLQQQKIDDDEAAAAEQRKLELLCASQLNDTLEGQGQEKWGSSFRYSPYPLTPFVGLSLSRRCPHFLAAVYFICCKQNSSTPPPPLLTACHAPPPNTWRAICRRLAVQSSFSFLFSAFSASSSFFSRSFLRFGSFCTAR